MKYLKLFKNVEDMSLPFLLKYFENGPYLA